MATRLDVQARRKALYESLKRDCLDGALPPGVMLPAVREVGKQHGVTNDGVFKVIQSLTEEGVLYTVPRVGTFVGRPQKETVEPYLMIVPAHEVNRANHWVQVQSGFEDRIAQLGGHSIVLRSRDAQSHMQQNDLPPLSGVFADRQDDSVHLLEDPGVPRVFLGALEDGKEDADCISFDDVGGGAQATRHLWQNGHRVIAFLALHHQEDFAPFSWSLRREAGWRKALEQAGGDSAGLSFHPQKFWGLECEDQSLAGREAAGSLMDRADITAVVAANISVAQGMFEAFQNAGWPGERWPAVVCFDAAPRIGKSVVSYLRLPWEEIGSEAAQLLWERRTGRLSGEAAQKLVPMRLIPRLSCRPDWATLSGGLTQSSFIGKMVSKRRIIGEPLSV